MEIHLSGLETVVYFQLYNVLIFLLGLEDILVS